jgi:tetratricopeptide (TPR) repeat protein
MLGGAIARFDSLDPKMEPRARSEKLKAQESLAKNLTMLGRTNESRQLLESILQEISAYNSSDPTREDFESVARVQVSLANLHRQRGDFRSATGALEKAVSHYASLREQWPDSLEYIENEAIAYTDIGLLWLNRRSPKNAKPFLERATKTFEQLQESYPKIARYSSALGTSWNGLGQVELMIDSSDNAAVDYLKQSQRQFQYAVGIHADDSSIENLAAATGQLGQAYEQRGAMDEARQSFQLSREYFLQLIENRPGEPRYAYGLAIVDWRWGKLEMLNGNPETANEKFQASSARLQSLTDQFPDNAEYHHRLCLNLIHSPSVSEVQLGSAEVHSREALELVPGNTLFAITRAEVLVATNQLTLARELLDSLAVESSENEFAEYYGVRAWLDRKAGNRESASHWLEICKRHVAEHTPHFRELQEWVSDMEKKVSE